MEIIGYSERGLINSLCYELKYSQNNLQLLNNLLYSVSFPYISGVNFNITEVKILIEQSFSDFGGADIVLLIENDGRKQIVFIEAKVKNCQRICRSISGEFDKFKEGIGLNKVSSSNLFVQLYHKVRLIKALQIGGIDQLKKGINFPQCSSKSIRKIGNNQVVLNAIKECKAYCQEAFFIALLPEDESNIRDFYNNTLINYIPRGFQDWDISKWGYISWKQISDFCNRNNLIETLKNFCWNKGQIY